MKRKTKRTGRKKWMAFFTPLSIILAFIVFFFNFLKESTIPILISLIKSLFALEDKSNLPFPILFCFSLATIALLSFIASKLILNYNKPNRNYFEIIDFKKPQDHIIKNAVEGILNSEKTLPHFVHAAPVNDEIDQLYKKLDTDGFVWENGKPGDGKSMLAYNAIYRFRKKIGLSFDITTFPLFKLKYKAYALKLKNISEENEIDSILNELDWLKGGKRKIILIDDAHKLSFEDKLRWEFEEEAKDKINGKFVWINTNYLDSKQSEKDESINISFEKFYPKLLKELYGSQHPVIRDVVINNCHGLQEAINLKEMGRIKDPWHFNFIATNGEQRIVNLLQKLSPVNEKQDILVLSVFLFSCRNILTGEKEINQTEFANLLGNIENPYFKNGIASYQPNIIISDLASQDKGRFLIIENKNSLDRGFLRAPHFKSSIAIIKSVVNTFSSNFIKQILFTSRNLLTKKYVDCKYFGVFFNSLGNYQEYYLNENKVWIKNFLTYLDIDQIQVYPPFLTKLKRFHNSFYRELITEDYFVTIATKISTTPSFRFSSIQHFIQILGNDKEKLIEKLNWETLATEVNNAEFNQLRPVADFINAIENDKEKLIQKLDWQKLATAANKAEIANFSQLAVFIIALGNDKDKLIKNLDYEKFATTANNTEVLQISKVAHFLVALGDGKTKLIKKFNWEKLATTANKAEVLQISKVAHFINAIDKYKGKLIEKLNWEKLAAAANKAEVANFSQLEAILNALESDKKKLIEKFDWEKLAITANNAEVANFSQLEAILTALENDKEKLIEKLNWESLANTANNAEVKQFKQVADFINVIGNDKEKLIEKFNWEKLASVANKAEVANFSQLESILNALESDKEKLIEKLNWEKLATTANNAEVAQINQVADFLIALGNDKKRLSIFLDEEKIIAWFKNIQGNQISSLCIIISSIENEKQNSIISKGNWIDFLDRIKINHNAQINLLSYILYYHNKKQVILKLPIANQDIFSYLENKSEEIVHYLTKYFTSPEDFQRCSNILSVLIPHSMELCRNIASKINYKIIRDFDITPRYYKSFSNLLGTINQISSVISKSIITNNLVKAKLYASFEDQSINEQLVGLQSLLDTIKNIDLLFAAKILSLQSIKDLKLDGIDINRINEDFQGI
jgi:hypothetical protein